MPAKDKWDDEEDSSSAASSPKFTAVRRNKFEDEEGEDEDVLDSWDAAEDSEAEREKAKKAAEAKAKAEAEKKANKKTTAQRIAIHQANRAAAKAAAEAESSDEETENQKRDRLRRAEKDSDLRHAEDLFGDAGAGASGRKTHTLSAAIPIDPSDPNKTVDLSALPLFNPKTKAQLEGLNKIVTPLLAQNHKMPQYVMFVQELTKTLVKELPSDQVKKIASSLTALSNEKMKAEKAGEKTSKKKGKGKTSLNTTRNNVEDVDAYQDQETFDDGDFM